MNQLAAPYGPERMIYSVRGAGGTNIGGESWRTPLQSGPQIWRVHLHDTTVVTPSMIAPNNGM